MRAPTVPGVDWDCREFPRSETKHGNLQTVPPSPVPPISSSFGLKYLEFWDEAPSFFDEPVLWSFELNKNLDAQTRGTVANTSAAPLNPSLRRWNPRQRL